MMHERRRPAQEVTPHYEDAGIFKTKLVQLAIELAPVISQNLRQDVLIKGFVNGGAVTVVFAGRRKTKVRTLLAQLQQMAKQAQNRGKSLDQVRMPVRVEGAWRKRFSRDEDGWETRDYEFVAARWLLVNQQGETLTFGEAPKL